MIVSVAQPLCNFADQGLSKGGRGILSPEMGEGMEYNVLKLSRVRPSIGSSVVQLQEASFLQSKET